MIDFEFNRIYVIESLGNSDRLTGEELYNDLLRWKEYEHKGFEAYYYTIDNRTDFFSKLNEVNEKCEKKGFVPILHLEIHGTEKGLRLKSGDTVSWEELYNCLIQINYSIGNNLFLTLAICHGAYLSRVIIPNKPAPFFGFIGSFDEISEDDLVIRYNEFYTEFFSSFDTKRAFNKLSEANPSVPSSYKLIGLEEIFVFTYIGYFKTIESRNFIKKYIKSQELQFDNRPEKRRYEKEIKAKFRSVGFQEKFYQECISNFYMLEAYPENRKRFNIHLTAHNFINCKF